MYSRLIFLSDNSEAELIPDPPKPKPRRDAKPKKDPRNSYEILHNITLAEEVVEVEFNYRFTKAYTKLGKTFTMSQKRIDNLISVNLLKAS